MYLLFINTYQHIMHRKHTDSIQTDAFVHTNVCTVRELNPRPLARKAWYSDRCTKSVVEINRLIKIHHHINVPTAEEHAFLITHNKTVLVMCDKEGHKPSRGPSQDWANDC
jgi:hypothetical protein